MMSNSKASPGQRSSRFMSMVDRLIPAAILYAEDQTDDDRARRARILILVIAIASIVGLLAGMNHYVDGSILRAVYTALAVIPFSAGILLLRRTERLEPAVHFLCAMFSAVVITSPLLSSGSVPLMAGLIAIPLAATAMGGARVGLIWTAIVLFPLVVSAQWYPFSDGERAVAWNIAILATGCGIVLSVTDFARERALRQVTTARRRANESLRVREKAERALVDSQAVFVAAFRGAPSALVLTVADTREVLDVNERFLRTLGISRNQIIGRTLADFGIWPGSAGEGEWIEGSDGGRELSEVEIRLQTVSGEEVWFLTSAKEIDIGGRVCRLAQGVDITERKRTDQLLERRREELEQRFAERGQQLKESQAQLRESERLAAVGTLAAGIAHQINNPIGGIVAASEFALTEEPGPDGEATLRGALETALDEARRCGRIVKSVLQFARDEATPKWVENLSPTVRRAGELARSYVESRGGHLEIEVSAAPLPVLMSPIDIEQVVLNLVRNAAESRPNGANVRVATNLLGEDSGSPGDHDPTVFAELTVSDNGAGIQGPARSQVFDPFYTTRLEDGGSGLGLSVVHGVVGDHGGRVDIEPIAKGGTRFRILLPLAKTPAPA